MSDNSQSKDTTAISDAFFDACLNKFNERLSHKPPYHPVIVKLKDKMEQMNNNEFADIKNAFYRKCNQDFWDNLNLLGIMVNAKSVQVGHDNINQALSKNRKYI